MSCVVYYNKHENDQKRVLKKINNIVYLIQKSPIGKLLCLFVGEPGEPRKSKAKGNI